MRICPFDGTCPTRKSIAQCYMAVNLHPDAAYQPKFDMLYKLMIRLDTNQTLVFVAKRADADKMKISFAQKGMAVDVFHAKLAQEEQTEV